MTHVLLMPLIPRGRQLLLPKPLAIFIRSDFIICMLADHSNFLPMNLVLARKMPWLTFRICRASSAVAVYPGKLSSVAREAASTVVEWSDENAYRAYERPRMC